MGAGSRGSLRHRLLGLVAAEPGLSVSEIAARLGASKSTVSVLVRRLEDEGLLRRVRRGSMVLVYPVQGAASGSSLAGAGAPRLRLGIVRAAEYPFIAHLAKALRRHGVELEVVVYDNGLDASFDLVSGRLDLALAPLPTQVLFYALTGRLRIIGGGAYGGAYVLESRAARGHTAYTTRASTMELCLNASGVVDYAEAVVYAGAGHGIEEALVRGWARYAALWEPYASRALSRGGVRVVAACSDLGVENCCTLAANPDRLGQEQRSLIARLYREALTEYQRRPDAMLEWYSGLTGIPVDTLRRVQASYRIAHEVNPATAERILERAGMKIPRPALVREAIEQP